MPGRRFLWLVLLLGAVVACGPSPNGAPSEAPGGPPPRPNIVVVIADDLGYGDLGCYGHATPSPALDRLAARGLRFTDFHTSSPVCSPTRAGFLTGRYPQRAGIDHVLAVESEAARARGLFAHEVTLPELLQQAGYATTLVGKWHLGYEDRFCPLVHGFDRFVGFRSGNVDHQNQRDMRGVVDAWDGDEPTAVDAYTTDWITTSAVRSLEEHRARRPQDPFFLVVSHAAVHEPLQGPDDPPLRRYGAPWRFPADHDDERSYRALVGALDASTGTLVDTLERLGLADDTLIVFFSDNGGLAHASNGELRGGKGQLYEGGHRVPAIVVWPGHVAPGVSDQFVTSLDWMPTLLALAGVEAPPERPLDGRDVGPLLFAREPLEPRPFFWSFGQQFAVREGTTKLFGVSSGERLRLELFDLERDPGEHTNLLDGPSPVAARLHRAHAAWLRDVLRDATRQPR